MVPAARRGWQPLASLVFAAAWALPGAAQDTPMVAGPPPATAVDPLGGMAPPPPIPPFPGAPGGCSCQDRRGLSRWRWHRAHCKRHLQETFLGFPEEFNEWPLGSALYAHGRTQVANAEAAAMIFYHYDFADGTDRLNLRGQDKLANLARRLPSSFSPVVVERTPQTPGLDESRRLAVLGALGQGGFPVPPERVLIGPPIANGLMGQEAIIVNLNRLGQVQAGGGGLGGATGPVGLDAGGLTGGVSAGGVSSR